jgi:hypothetical protein
MIKSPIVKSTGISSSQGVKFFLLYLLPDHFWKDRRQGPLLAGVS